MKRDSEQVLLEWLVLSAQYGEQEALTALCQRLYPKLLAYARRQLASGDQESANDAVQMTMEVVSTNLGAVKDPAAFKSWVYRILHHKLVDVVRANVRSEKLNAAVESTETTADSLALSLEDTVALEDVLSRLEKTDYQLVHLHYLEGFSSKEIARLLNIAEGTVKSRLFAVRKKLIELSNDEYQTSGEHHD